MSNWKLLPLCVLLGVSQAGVAAPLSEGVLGRFVGTWAVTGTTRGETTVIGAEVRPQFGGAFLEMHIKDPAGKLPYEARVYLGQADDGSIVAHWLDGTGGESSRTLGSGRIVGDQVELSFPYRAGEFRNRLEYDRRRDRWRMFIEMGPKEHSKIFSDWYFERDLRP
ncbi:hypothetical protein SH591_00520 [Sphingomonas sp. LY54]|uniref:hypothetical protein n=1 Tax=Sphingomonas sp. LY54 TaxID=3095343 RepID=UPI002D769DC7|nr:hypothetical protein [Sphingomonas sp. LY54]WRP28707.1 hypothetical protein SH591_00520 [Sphingomonas sp. LY54]